jgi:glycosyl transferase, family 25
MASEPNTPDDLSWTLSSSSDEEDDPLPPFVPPFVPPSVPSSVPVLEDPPPLRAWSDLRHVVYINLDHRTDRREHMRQQLEGMGLSAVATRFPAIRMDSGMIGCSLSHLKVLEDAHAHHWPHVLVLEDDITFLQPRRFQTLMTQFFTRHPTDWDVVLLAGNNRPPFRVVDDGCVQVTRCQTTTGYLVQGAYLPRLIQNVRMGVTRLIARPDRKHEFAIDQFWFSLQRAHRWFLPVPLTVVQREDYSDIERRHTDYRAIMQDLDKASRYAASENH